MIKAVDVLGALEPLPVLHGRTPDTPAAAASAAFATLVTYEAGGVFAGRFDGTSPWERHPGGDELVQILQGAAKVTLLTQDGPTVLDMRAGMLTVVPRDCWHRFEAPMGVTVLTMTPRPTIHSRAADPRMDAAAG
ncbi:MAG: cupin domain-containing protein [Rhodospirillaceae bacterium]|nr:cupin domain-containing protein [Rhodospirillaceae bacterium]